MLYVTLILHLHLQEVCCEIDLCFNQDFNMEMGRYLKNIRQMLTALKV